VFFADSRSYEWVVMELVGASLAELRSALCGVFSPSTALKLAFKALNCLEEMHMLGIVHGDVKPGNFAMGVGEEADKLLSGFFFFFSGWVSAHGFDLCFFFFFF
jgi:serine/threonine protein kinase